jgi:hypothetical protein
MEMLTNLTLKYVAYGCDTDQYVAYANPSVAVTNADNYNVSAFWFSEFLVSRFSSSLTTNAILFSIRRSTVLCNFRVVPYSVPSLMMHTTSYLDSTMNCDS